MKQKLTKLEGEIQNNALSIMNRTRQKTINEIEGINNTIT